MTSTNKVLLVIFFLLLSAVLLYGASLFFSDTGVNIQSTTEISESSTDSAEYVIGGDSLPQLKTNQAYMDASKAYEQHRYADAANLFAQAADATVSKEEQLSARIFEAKAYRHGGETIAAIQAYKKIIVDKDYPDEGNITKASAVHEIVSAYVSDSTEVTFNEVFYGEPNIFSSLVVIDSENNTDIDASLTNLYEYSTDTFGVSLITEIQLANDLFNNNVDIYDVVFNNCRESEGGSLNGCTPDVQQLLTPEQIVRFNDIVTEYKKREPVINDLLRIFESNAIGRDDWASLSKYANRFTRVLHKAMYFGLVHPDDVEVRAQDAVAFARSALDQNAEVTARLEYGVFLTLQNTAGDLEKNDEVILVIRPVYADAALTSGSEWHIGKMVNNYQSVLAGSVSQQSHMSLRGQIALSMADPGYKSYLEENAGWDFSESIITQYTER